jgi:gamma-glutamyltranspeptidase / glutathione hydrolase
VSTTIDVPYVTRHAPNGMVCSIDHLASGAGVEMLRAGGSAADAAVATSAVLAVTSQHMCGMGGDLWALVHFADGEPPAALNASGRAGSGADPGRLRAEGFTDMPFQGDARSIPVPGCVDGWVALSERFGRLPLAEVLAPAIALAEDGFPIGPQCAAATEQLVGLPNTDDYVASGIPSAGRRIVRRGVAAALRTVVEGGREAHYQGEFGAALIEFGAGEYSPDDLALVNADWVDPISVDAFGHRLWTVPPNSQGYLSLAGAWIADQLDLPTDATDPVFTHLLVEAAKQAGYDRPDVLHEHADGAQLVSAARLAPRAAGISRQRVAPVGGHTSDGDTIYLNAVDGGRMGVSLIQSNASGWGALAFLPGSRISLHNRGLGFSTVEGHPAEYGPRRRPPHTLAPALVQTLGGALRAVIGTMGGDSQPQVVLQLLARLLHAGEDPGHTVAAGRWRLAGSNPSGFHTWADPDQLALQIEGHGTDTDDDLSALGHRVRRIGPHHSAFGHAHLIDVVDGVLAGASDPRALTGGVAGY